MYQITCSVFVLFSIQTKELLEWFGTTRESEPPTWAFSLLYHYGLMNLSQVQAQSLLKNNREAEGGTKKGGTKEVKSVKRASILPILLRPLMVIPYTSFPTSTYNSAPFLNQRVDMLLIVLTFVLSSSAPITGSASSVGKEVWSAMYIGEALDVLWLTERLPMTMFSSSAAVQRLVQLIDVCLESFQGKIKHSLSYEHEIVRKLQALQKLLSVK